MVYIDLNVRPARQRLPKKASSPACRERAADLKSADEVSTPDAQDVRVERGPKAGWLAPVELDPKRKKVREKSNSRRATNKTPADDFGQYLQLVDWTGRQLRPGKRRDFGERSAGSGSAGNVGGNLAAHGEEVRKSQSRDNDEGAIKGVRNVVPELPLDSVNGS
ncbi:MAG: hypothetical protein R3C19_22505 [Planctomycetaceae bacterium]